MAAVAEHVWIGAFLVFLGLSASLCVQGQTCQLPAGMRNKTMTSNAVGKVTVKDSSIVFDEGLRGCTAPLCSSTTSLTFNCQEKHGDVYLFKSQVIPDGSNKFVLYICWYIGQPLSGQKWVYYQGPNASLTSQSSSCPDALLGTFDAKQPTTSCVTEFNVCNATTTRQTIEVQNPDCRPDKFFTANGKMDCLHSLSENSVTYVTTYTPESSTVTFACLAYIQQGNTLYLAMKTSVCDRLNAPTTASYQVSLESNSFECNFPTELLGTWKNSRKGQEVTFSTTQLSDFVNCSNPPCSGAVNAMDCYRTENSSYLLRSPVTTISGQSVRVYVCLQLTRLSSTKYLYYQLHKNLHATVSDYVATFNPGQAVTVALGCDDLTADPYPATRHHVLIRSGSESSSFSACPEGLVGEFTVAAGPCQSSFEACADNSRLTVTGTACSPKPFFSGGGSLGCLYNVSVSGTTYVTLYNADASPDNNATFAFTCVGTTSCGGGV
ncbi:hypothetical protein ACOMHN_039694 [Nucella lapillus]